jgi:hypothetical protein
MDLAMEMAEQTEVSAGRTGCTVPIRAVPARIDGEDAQDAGSVKITGHVEFHLIGTSASAGSAIGTCKPAGDITAKEGDYWNLAAHRRDQ